MAQTAETRGDVPSPMNVVAEATGRRMQEVSSGDRRGAVDRNVEPIPVAACDADGRPGDGVLWRGYLTAVLSNPSSRKKVRREEDGNEI